MKATVSQNLAGIDAREKDYAPMIQSVDQAVGIMDSLCASPCLPPALYDWQKEAWTYIRSYISYKRTALVNKWSGYMEGFETEQNGQSQVYPSGYVRKLLESFVSDLKSGLEKFEEVQKV